MSVAGSAATGGDMAAPAPAEAEAARPRPAQLLIGARPTQPMAWWLDPLKAIAFIVLPIFCAAAYLNRFNYWSFGASRDFITPQTFALGLYSAGLVLVGIIVGLLALPRRAMLTVIDADRATRVLLWVGWIAVGAHVLLLGTLLANLWLVLELFRGNPAASGELRLALGRIPGVTSLAQFNVVYLALLSALVTLAGYRMPPRVRTLAIAVFVLTFLRSIMNSERLALLEVLAALFVIPVAYRWRPSAWRAGAPFLGILGVFLTFLAGEYFRSWQYYRQFYASYLDFATQRFAGYFSTSINNGSGAYLMYGRIDPVPEITAGWLTRFPVLGSYFDSGEQLAMDQYLAAYANPEFNNAGGFYAAFLDYGFITASLFMLGVGLAIGLIYRGFTNKSLFSLILYPMVFLGVTDFIRIIYMSETRTLPIVLGTVFACYALRLRSVPRDRAVVRPV